MNIIARLEYELAYYDSAVHRFNHYTTRTPPNRVGRGLSLNRSQCGGCSTKYDTPSLNSSGLQAIPRLTLHGGFETRQRRQNPACRGCRVVWPVRARRRVCNSDEEELRHRKEGKKKARNPRPRPPTKVLARISLTLTLGLDWITITNFDFFTKVLARIPLTLTLGLDWITITNFDFFHKVLLIYLQNLNWFSWPFHIKSILSEFP